MRPEAQAPPERRDRGHFFEEFAAGQRYRHHWGRTITEGEAVTFAATTLNANPLYFNAPYAKAHGHPEIPVDPLLAWNVAFGLTVEDLSFKVAGAGNLGYPVIRFLRPVYPGDTLYAESEVLATGPWKGANDCGVVHVHTWGLNQHGERVLEYERKILVRKRGGAS
ncbi:MAG TPA: MaoC family dehydratase [Candidatus Eisenbacteria bacterium]|jgi:acyl dehydratase